MILAIVVSDTSPIRALWHLSRLDLLTALFGEVLIPPAVVTELERPKSSFEAIPVREVDFIRVRAPSNRVLVSKFSEMLDAGEAEAIALAVELKADAVLIDESAGRAVVEQRGLVPVGVLGILLRAKEQRLIGPIEPLLDRLEETRFFLSESLRRGVLRQAGELDRP